MRTHGAAGREATSAMLDDFLAQAMAAATRMRKARTRRGKAAATAAPKPFKVMGFQYQEA